MFSSVSQQLKGALPGRRLFRRLALASFVLAGLYAAGAASLGIYYKHIRGFSDVRYRDVAMPNRWHRVNATIGHHLIALALESFQRHDYPAGLHLLRAGLRKAPTHRGARWALAQIHFERGEYEAAQNLLMSGLAHHSRDPDYVAKLLQFLFRRQLDTIAKEICDRLLNGSDPSTPTTLALAAWGAASASQLRGHYDTAQDYLIHYRLDQGREGRLLLARIEWERNYRELALNHLRALAGEFPGDEEIHLQLAEYLHTSELRDERRRLLMLLALARPDLARPRIERLRDYDPRKDANQLARESAYLLRDFADNPAGLLALGDYASATGNVALARQVQSRLPDQGASADAAALLVAEAKQATGDFSGALADVESLQRRDPALPPELVTAALGLQTVAYFGLGQTAAGYASLQAFMLRPGLRPENLFVVSRRLAELQALPAARSALAKAVAIDPLNQSALTALIELELQTDELDEIPGLIHQLLQMRKPAPTTLRAVQHALSRDYLLFSPEHRRTLRALDQHLTPADQ